MKSVVSVFGAHGAGEHEMYLQEELWGIDEMAAKHVTCRAQT